MANEKVINWKYLGDGQSYIVNLGLGGGGVVRGTSRTYIYCIWGTLALTGSFWGPLVRLRFFQKDDFQNATPSTCSRVRILSEANFLQVFSDSPYERNFEITDLYLKENYLNSILPIRK